MPERIPLFEHDSISESKIEPSRVIKPRDVVSYKFK